MSGLPRPGVRFFRIAGRSDLAVFVAAIVVAVASSTTVGWFTDRLERGIRLESATVLAADRPYLLRNSSCVVACSMN